MPILSSLMSIQVSDRQALRAIFTKLAFGKTIVKNNYVTNIPLAKRSVRVWWTIYESGVTRAHVVVFRRELTPLLTINT